MTVFYSAIVFGVRTLVILMALSLVGAPDGEWMSMRQVLAQTQRDPMPTPPAHARPVIPMPMPSLQPAVP